MKNKKFIFLMLLSLLFLPLSVFAKETCEVVNPSGKSIGSEVKCGNEYFYIIENNNNTIKMLAKYNLNIGYTYTRLFVNENEDCSTLVPMGYNSDNYWSGTTKDNKMYCMYYKKIDEDVLQNSKAIGAHGNEKGEPEFPEVGVISFWGNTAFTNLGETYSSGYKDGELKSDYDNMKLAYDSLQTYKNNLNDKGYEITNIDLISVKEINNFTKVVTGKDLPLKEWYESTPENISEYNSDYYYQLGDLKEYLSDDYSWLWSTTYWTKTVAAFDSSYAYFVDTLGYICSGRECEMAIGAGVRPVITVPKDKIKYNIKTKTDGNGTIEVVSTAFGGDSIQFKVSAKKGLKLAGLTVTSDNGEKVEFKEEDITVDASGIYSISTNKFTMPFDNVTIEARWSSVNPKTGVNIILVSISLLLVMSISLTLIITSKKKYSKN